MESSQISALAALEAQCRDEATKALAMSTVLTPLVVNRALLPLIFTKV